MEYALRFDDPISDELNRIIGGRIECAVAYADIREGRMYEHTTDRPRAFPHAWLGYSLTHSTLAVFRRDPWAGIAGAIILFSYSMLADLTAAFGVLSPAAIAFLATLGWVSVCNIIAAIRDHVWKAPAHR